MEEEVLSGEDVLLLAYLLEKELLVACFEFRLQQGCHSAGTLV